VKSKEIDGLDTWIDWPEKNYDSFGGGKPVFGGRRGAKHYLLI